MLPPGYRIAMNSKRLAQCHIRGHPSMGQQGDSCRLGAPVAGVINVDGRTAQEDSTLAIIVKHHETTAEGNTK
jgi:hypothetical protein